MRLRRPALSLLSATLVALPVTAAVSAGPADAKATAPVATTATLTGAGFGHGVGMSQYGARGQALEGRTGEQIAAYYYTGATVAPVNDSGDVRVNTSHSVPSVELSAHSAGVPGGYWRLTVDDKDPIYLGLSDKATVKGVEGHLTLHVTRQKGDATDVTGGSVHVEWAGSRGMADKPATVLVSNGDQLRHGDVRITPSKDWGGSSGRLEVVNTLVLHDEYLFGLAEVPSSWPLQALRAQVIAARSYAVHAVQAHPQGIRSCGGCQLYDTDDSQVFRGWKKEAEVIGGVDYGALWRQAVQSTDTDASNGLVATVGGAPINAYFFSSSGGRTRNSEDVWSSVVSYARSVDDHWSLDANNNPYASWTVQVPASQVAGAFGLGSLASLAVTVRDVSGAATQVQAVDGDGNVRTITGEDFRRKLGLRSSWVRTTTLDVTPPVADPPTLSIVYREAGPHTLRGRNWTTSCTTHQGTLRCVAQPFGTYYVANPKVRGGVIRKSGFQAAATAYTAKATPMWDTNAYAHPGTFTDSAGRAWTVTCTAPVGGPRLCVSTVHAKVLAAVKSRGRYHLVRKDMDLVRRYVRLTN
ncbi:SpoIID/LytB domain protein [Motilibacter peucedani]|uniref:SpoIID/LytB domain protein n=1 Tax=Motilibacter peucedani TaxID=598650 RepID=A0A420XLU6_9ACTN|nr:SpoIID/LytB domain-containing protein [Motilibacter peucedani]RKS71462.1 SpoIID/LytB domain protein [Motilibacter peucedani]